jgi:HEAT repeat protein
MALIKKTTDLPEEQAVYSQADLLAQLDNQDATIRRDAVRQLAEQLNDDVIVKLAAMLETETDSRVMDAIALVLIDSQTMTAVECLIPLLRSQNALLRNIVIDALSKLPLQVENEMHSLLHDEDPDVRIFAINIMESLRSEQVPAWLQTVINEDDHVNVVATALDLLSELGTPDMCADISNCQQRFHDEPYIHFVASRVLSRLGCLS